MIVMSDEPNRRIHNQLRVIREAPGGGDDSREQNTPHQLQSERDNNRRRQWEQVAKRGQVGFLWAFCRLQEIYIYWRFHFNQQKNKTMYVIAESGDTGLLLYKNIGKGKSLSMEDFPVLMFRED